ncbi:MAG: PKD domain-containing protein [Ferruginibacter sp.]
MKRLITLLILALSFFSMTSVAQTNTSCNAQFSFTLTAGSTVHFVPALIGDSNATVTSHHSWSFGDGTASSNVDPNHTYANCGTFSVKHIFWRTTPNGVICSDTVIKPVVIQCPTSCNIHAAYSYVRDSIHANIVHFTNLSSPTADVHFSRWSFGDGSYSTDFNPTHAYTASGLFTVCLEVRKDSAGLCKDDTCMSIQIQVTTTPVCNLQAYFSWHADSTQLNKIYFQNQTLNFLPTDSIRWTFGDGSVSYDVNPTHIYSQPGSYNVCIRVSRITTAGTAPCVSEFCKTVIVYGPACTLQANFTWQPDATHPTKIHFSNTSVPLSTTDSIRWTFGDGTTSFDVSPVHTYNVPGVYTVCLRVKKNYNVPTLAPCVSEICKTVVVQGVCNLVVDFSSHPDSLQSNKIHFTNLSTPLNTSDSIKWTFGDGTVSYDVNPTHIYTQGGSYTVCLRVKENNSAAGTTACVREICKTITVTLTSCNFTPSYTWHADSVNHKKIYFTNTTASPSSVATATWSFGDGSTGTGWNAVHEYAQPGQYVVCLRIEAGPNCVKYKCDSITVVANEPACNDLSKFTYQVFSNDYLKYKFTPDYQNTALLYIWSFGDGSGSNNMITDHRYAQPGVYHVCLTVFRNNTCVSTLCKEIRIYPQIICDSIHVNYQYTRDAYVPNKYYFYAISNFPLLQQRWTFTRISPTPAPAPVVLYQNNPVYVFGDTGVYRVCLRAITLGGCVKEYCDNIHVTQVLNTTQCNLQAYPNPATNVVNVNVQLQSPEMIHAYVYNALNVLVKQKDQQGLAGNNIVTISLENLVPGWYTIKLIYGTKVCYARFQKI